MINRINQLLEVLNISIRAFAMNCGVNTQTLHSQLTGRRELSLQVVYAILAKYPTLSVEWLFRGHGSMFADSNAMDASTSQELALVGIIENLQNVINESNRTIDNLNTTIKNFKS